MDFIDQDKFANEVGIYKITQMSTGMCYIGQTRQRFIRRYWHNRWVLQHNMSACQPLQAAFNESGDSDFEFSVLDVVSDVSKLDGMEIYRIAEARSSCGAFNISSGGSGRKAPLSEKAKQLIGEANRVHMTGKRLSDETRAKMRESSKHVSPTAEHRQILSEYMSNRSVSDNTKEKLRLANEGSKSPSAIIDESTAYEIKRCLMTGVSVKEVAEINNVSYGIASQIANDRTWNHVIADGWDTFVVNRKRK